MPRQNFLSRESFVDATEKQTRETILSIPDSLPGIRYLGENRLNESIKFSYVLPPKDLEYLIDVTVLPLNEKYTRVSLHACHINGHVFHSDTDMAFALHDFEAAIQAAVKGELMHFKPFEPRISPLKKVLQFIVSLKIPATAFSVKKSMQTFIARRQAVAGREQ